MALVRLLAVCLAVLGVGACGGGGGGGTAGSKLFVADSGTDAIGSVANPNPGAGSVKIDRIVTGTSSNSISGTIPALLLDAARDQLYVSNETSIFVFHNARFANGPVEYNRRIATIAPLHSGNFNSLQLDAGRDMLYVGDLSAGVRVYHNASSSNEAGGPDRLPDRTISTPSIGAGAPPLLVRDIALDAGRDVLYVAVDGQSGPPSMSVLVFDHASGRDGATLVPDRTITISASAFGTMGLYIDAANDRLYVADSSGSVLIFEAASTKSGSIGADRGVSLPSVILRLAVDSMNDRLYAAGSSALYIVPTISTAPAGPLNATAAVAAPGSVFTAVAFRP